MRTKRYSKQREMIFRQLCSTKEHPSAETVYQELKSKSPELSLGTVYRNLNLLAEEGTIMRMPLAINRYDANAECHPHFQCRVCGRMLDLEIPCDSVVQVAREAGFQPERFHLIFEGVCPACQKAGHEK